jgi:hypothetical protein
LLPSPVSERISGKGVLGLSASFGDPKENRDHDLASSSLLNERRQKKLQEARMEFQVPSAVVLAVTLSGAMRTAAPDSRARHAEALGMVDDSDPVWRDASKTWGDARLLTSIYLATE